MEHLNHYPAEVPWLEILIFTFSIGLVLIAFNYTVLNDSAEQPVNFIVPLPEQCKPGWKGEVLEDPSIKVFSPISNLFLLRA